MNQITICYRREDSADVTGRIYDRLVDAFGDDSVFKDVDSMPLGVNFRTYLDGVISESSALLVVIGQKWLTCVNAAGGRRLDDAQDVVRLEIETAFARRIPIIPLLVQGASMPAEASLPVAIKDLASYNGTTIGHDPIFQSDVDRLIRNLASIVPVPVQREWIPDNGAAQRRSWRSILVAIVVSAGLAVAASYFFYIMLAEPLTTGETLVVLTVLLPFVLVGQRMWRGVRRIEANGDDKR